MRCTTQPARRVLHIVGRMDRGGVETWLLSVLRYINHKQYEFHFCCLSGEAGVYAAEIEALGGKVFTCRLTKNLVMFNQRFDDILGHGQYDVVHSHVHHFSGYILWRAARAGIRTRIAHSFTAPTMTAMPLTRHIYLRLMSTLISRYATIGLGNSTESMRSLFGARWQSDKRWKLMYLGIDLATFIRPVDRGAIRRRYGVPDGALVIGHVGRLTPAKNHRFLIDIATELERQCDNVWLVIVGDGSLRAEIQAYARAKGVARLVMTGSVEEISPLYGMMDLFVFPSLWEGLPQAVIEAQAAGLHCVCASTVTKEVAIVPQSVRFVPLADGAEQWAQVCSQVLKLPRVDQRQALSAVAASPFTIEQSITALSRLYAARD